MRDGAGDAVTTEAEGEKVPSEGDTENDGMLLLDKEAHKVDETRGDKEMLGLGVELRERCGDLVTDDVNEGRAEALTLPDGAPLPLFAKLPVPKEEELTVGHAFAEAEVQALENAELVPPPPLVPLETPLMLLVPLLAPLPLPLVDAQLDAEEAKVNEGPPEPLMGEVLLKRGEMEGEPVGVMLRVGVCAALMVALTDLLPCVVEIEALGVWEAVPGSDFVSCAEVDTELDRAPLREMEAQVEGDRDTGPDLLASGAVGDTEALLVKDGWGLSVPLRERQAVPVAPLTETSGEAEEEGDGVVWDDFCGLVLLVVRFLLPLGSDRHDVPHHSK